MRSPTSDAEPILRVENLEKYYDSTGGLIDTLLGRSQWVKAVDGIDLELYPGETLGIVGESGCGKTTLGRAMLRLIEPTGGTVSYNGEDLTAASSSRLRDLRTEIQYIFQDPFSSLNPRLTVGDIIGEPLDIHEIAAGSARTDRVYELLETVGLSASHANRYPHEFSGGQRQRIGIARALAVDPSVIVCDEPMSALDVSVQAQILNLLKDLQDDLGLSYVFIAHDLSVVEHIADRVAVMYLGEVAEVGPTANVFEPPYHPYAEALLSAIPEPDPLWEGERVFLSGTVPSPIDPPSGCRFHTRCPAVIQPETDDLPPSTWRSLMDLKLLAQQAETLDSITTGVNDRAISEPAAATANGRTDADDHIDGEGRTDPETVSESKLDTMIRDRFDLPDPLGDPDAERALSEATTQFATSGLEAGVAVLNDAITSPCEQHHPDPVDQGDGHQISCLRFDDRFDEATGQFTESTI